MGKIQSRRELEQIQEVFTEASKPIYTPHQMSELIRCHNDPHYFVDTYLHLKDPTFGTIAFTCRDYQQIQLGKMMKNSLMCLQPRQAGATSIGLAFQLWEAMFRSDANHGAAFTNHNRASDGMTLLRYWYDNLPTWLRAGLVYSNHHTLRFDNGSRIVCGVINSAFNRGQKWMTLNIDSFSYATEQDQADFWHAAIPSVIPGRVFMIGVPNGPTNTFAQIWHHLIQNPNINFHTMHVPADVIYPKLKRDNIRQLIGDRNYRREYDCEFIA